MPEPGTPGAVALTGGPAGSTGPQDGPAAARPGAPAPGGLRREWYELPDGRYLIAYSAEPPPDA